MSTSGLYMHVDQLIYVYTQKNTNTHTQHTHTTIATPSECRMLSGVMWSQQRTQLPSNSLRRSGQRSPRQTLFPSKQKEISPAVAPSQSSEGRMGRCADTSFPGAPYVSNVEEARVTWGDTNNTPERGGKQINSDRKRKAGHPIFLISFSYFCCCCFLHGLC